MNIGLTIGLIFFGVFVAIALPLIASGGSAKKSKEMAPSYLQR